MGRDSFINLTLKRPQQGDVNVKRMIIDLLSLLQKKTLLFLLLSLLASQTVVSACWEAGGGERAKQGEDTHSFSSCMCAALLFFCWQCIRSAAELIMLTEPIPHFGPSEHPQ